MDPQALILVLAFVMLLIVGMPVAFALGISALLAIISVGTLPSPLQVSRLMATGIDSFPLLAIPFFIVAGELMGEGGMATRLLALANAIFGRVRGGLAYVNTVTCMLFGAISGSAAAAVSSIGGIMIPQMREAGYKRDFAVSVTVTSATTGLLIPPSNIMIVYAVVAQNVSIAAIFLAGVMPGIVLGIMLMVASALVLIGTRVPSSRGAERTTPQPAVAAVKSPEECPGGGPGSQKEFCIVVEYDCTIALFTFLGYFVGAWIGTWTELGPWVKVLGGAGGAVLGVAACFWRTFRASVPSLVLIFIVLGGILGGAFSATEAAAIAVAYSFVLGVLVYRELSMSQIPALLLRSAKTTGIVFLLIAASQAMAWVLTRQLIPQYIAETMLSLSQSPIVLLLIINITLLVVGTFMDMTPAVLIFTPIFLPIAVKLGMDPVHFGIVLIMNLCIGLCTPPVGTCLFIGCGVGKTSIEAVSKSMIPFWIAMFIALLIVTYVPAFSMALPRWAGWL